MNVQQIIHAAADDADDFLTGISAEKDARPAIREYLKGNHPGLTAAEENQVIGAVIAILKEEGFFESSAGADSLDEGGGGSDDEP